MIIGNYIRKVFLYRLLAVFGVSFTLAMFLELTTALSQPNVTENISKFVYYTFCKGIVFTDSALFFITLISTVIFANYISNSRQLEIILLYKGNPMFFFKQISSVIFTISLLYIFVFHGFFYHKITNFMNTYKTTYIMKTTVPKLWLQSIETSTPENIKGDVFLLTNIKMYQSGFIVENIFHYKIAKGTLGEYKKYSKTFITNTPTKEMVFFSFEKDSHIARNPMPNVKFNDIHTAFIQNGTKAANQTTYSELHKIFNQSQYQSQVVKFAHVYLLNILQITFLMFGSCILVLAYLLNVTGRNITYSFATIKVIAYSIIIYAMTEIVKMIYPHTTINYIVSLMLTFAVILIFTSKFVKKYC